MINSVPVNTNNTKSNKVGNVAIIAGGTAIGAGGGRLVLKAAGYDKFVKGELEELSRNISNTIEAGKTELKNKHFQVANSSDKYANLIATKRLSGQEFGKDFQLSDFFDAQDMKKYDDELKKFLSDADDVTRKGAANIKSASLKKGLKYAGIGAAIGLGIAALVVGIKTHLNKKQNSKVQSAN